MKMICLFFCVILLILLINGDDLFAGKGLIVTHEGTLFLKPDKTSPVVDRVKKNQEIYIHDHAFIDYKGQFERFQKSDIITENDKALVSSPPATPAFYITVDRNGQTAFIPSESVKLIYNDLREFEEELPSAQNDLSDYRLVEPLPNDYPFYTPSFSSQFFLYLGAGVENHRPYPYQQTIVESSQSLSYDISFAYCPKAFFSLLPETRIGVMVSFLFDKHAYALEENQTAIEDHQLVGSGLILHQNLFQSPPHQMVAFLGPIIYWETTNFSRKDRFKRESKTFMSYPVSLKGGFFYQRLDILGKNQDIILGSSFELTPSHKVAAVSDRYRKGFEGRINFVIGVATRPF